MSGKRWNASGAKAAAVFLMLAGLAGCAASEPAPGPSPQPQAAAPPPAPQPPPVDLAGRWHLVAAAGGACFMTFGNAPGAVQGTIAPEGGCPGNFFTSRKWTFERGVLVVRDHKGEPLTQLSFSGGHFEGQDASGATLTLSR